MSIAKESNRDGLILGMDGGGSKTACLLMDLQGNILVETEGIGINYRQYGVSNVLATIRQLTDDCMKTAGVSEASLTGVCIGMPSYGEHPPTDNQLAEALYEMFPRLMLVNDVHVGWAGSLALGSGINLVSGTGSIAFGVDGKGRAARSGGWSERIGDEGSSYWLAVMGMQLFTKQSDGRQPRGPLYRLIKEKFRLGNDFEFVPLIEEQYLPYREKVASFHYLVAQAAEEQDITVIDLYQKAAEELFSLVMSVFNQLGKPAECRQVSYSGGTFKVGEVLLGPLRKLLDKEGLHLQSPMFSPVAGALLLAIRQFASQHLDSVLAALTCWQSLTPSSFSPL
ncbi:MAG: ATPase [Clostridiales bacterium]|nr:ATPase [Clostridiales bacterium]